MRSRGEGAGEEIGVLRRTIGRLTREKATAPMQLGKCCLVWPKLSGYHVCNKVKMGISEAEFLNIIACRFTEPGEHPFNSSQTYKLGSIRPK